MTPSQPIDRAAARAFLDETTNTLRHAAVAGVLSVADRMGLLSELGQGLRGTASEIASALGVDERFTTEVLRTLAAAGVIENDTSGYSMTPEHAAVLGDDTSPYSLAGWLDMLPAAVGLTGELAEGGATGAGVPFDAYGPAMVRGIDRANRPSMTILLTRRWLPTMPDVVDRLDAGVRVVDVGCGSGAAVHAMAAAYPNSTIVGIDISETSIERARASCDLPNAHFEIASISSLATGEPADLITAFDVLHDIPDPTAALKDMRAGLADGGVVLAMEPRIERDDSGALDDVAVLNLAISTLHCLPQAIATGGTGVGAAWGADGLSRAVRDAGFAECEELPIENPFSAFYRISG